MSSSIGDSIILNPLKNADAPTPPASLDTVVLPAGYSHTLQPQVNFTGQQITTVVLTKTSLDSAFAKSGRDYLISVCVFVGLGFFLSIVACASPWRLYRYLNYPIEDCAFALNLIYYGTYGPKCPESPSQWGKKTWVDLCSSSSSCQSAATVGQFAAALLSLAVILCAVGFPASVLAALRFSRAYSSSVPPSSSLDRFASVQVCMALVASAFSIGTVGALIGDSFIYLNSPGISGSVSGAGEGSANVFVIFLLIACVLSIVLKFKLRGAARISPPHL